MVSALYALHSPLVDGMTTPQGTISQWAQGNVYSGTSGSGKFVQSSLTGPTKPASLLVDGKVGPLTSLSGLLLIEIVDCKPDPSSI